MSRSHGWYRLVATYSSLWLYQRGFSFAGVEYSNQSYYTPASALPVQVYYSSFLNGYKKRKKKVWIPFSSTRFLKIFIFCNVNIFEWIFMTLYPCIFLKVKIISWCLLLIVWCFFLLLKDINPVIQPVRPTCLDDSFVTAASNLVIFRGNENKTKINQFLRMPFLEDS